MAWLHHQTILAVFRFASSMFLDAYKSHFTSQFEDDREAEKENLIYVLVYVEHSFLLWRSCFCSSPSAVVYNLSAFVKSKRQTTIFIRK